MVDDRDAKGGTIPFGTAVPCLGKRRAVFLENVLYCLIVSGKPADCESRKERGPSP